MPAKSILPLLLAVLLCFSTSVGADQQERLSTAELDRFIEDTPDFIAQVKKLEMDRHLIDLFLHPDRIESDKPLYDILVALSWEPGRYAYIFSHVIIGGFIRDMGEFGEGKLEFLKDQRDKWQASDEPEPNKSKIVTDLSRSIVDLEEIVTRTKKIPKTELLLLWSKRDQLNDVLMGKLPIGRKKMKALQ